MSKRKRQENDEISVDFKKTFSSVNKFFSSEDKKQRRYADYLITGVLLLALLILVWNIRTLPTDLPITEQWAEQNLLQGIRAQIDEQITRQYPALPPENKASMIEKELRAVLNQNQAAFEASRVQYAQQYKTGLQYTGEDGKQYTYLGDLDSYYWLRYTRNWLETGDVCDGYRDGQCWDHYIVAPVGAFMSENPGLHVFAIGFLHKIITTFNPNKPLPATSFLIPVILGTLLVIPAFFVGRRLAGNTAGVIAAIIVALHPLVLSRSMGSDNDIWNVFMPMLIMWMAVEAIEAKSRKNKVIFASLAGLACAIFALAWVAWWFIYLIILLALLGNLGYRAISYFYRKKNYKLWDDEGVKTATLLVGVFYVATGFFLFALQTDVSLGTYATTPFNAVGASTYFDRAVADSYWPNVLTTVAELNKASFHQAMIQMGGIYKIGQRDVPLYFILAMIGMMLLVLPKNTKWRAEHWILFVVGVIISFYLGLNPGKGKFTILAILMLPIILILILDLIRDYKVDVGVAMVVLVWMAATIYTAYTGVRFILLMAPVYAVAFSVVAGRIFEWSTNLINKEFKWNKIIVSVAIFAVLMLLLITPVKSGAATAKSFTPSIDDGWWDALTKIKETSAEDAIINSWWDFGHWFKYVADRRVTADGTSQHTHAPHWLGKALVTSDERESIGILRMLNCGNDAFPSEDGWEGAYGKTLRVVEDPILAHDIVLAIVNMNEDDAKKYLEEAGFTDEQAGSVLEKTHCPVVEDYFITSGDMVGKAGVWAHFGLWDFRKAWIADEGRNLPQGEAIQIMQDKFGYERETAEQLYFDAKALGSDQGRINAWISPWPGYVTGNWIGGCQEQDNETTILCPLNLGVGNQGTVQTVIDGVVYNTTDPDSSFMQVSGYSNGKRIASETGSPAVLVLALEEEMEVIEFEDSTSNIALIIDVPGKRVLAVDPNLATSIFTQLFYLDGRYNKHFEMFDDRRTFSNSRILTWKVSWDGTAEN